jgi:hypothetical protein
MTNQALALDDLIAQRTVFATDLANCDPDAFPGSRAAKARREAEIILDTFDAAHPEVIKEIRARKRAGIAARTIPAGGR